jgi:hypothetical protein
MPSQNAILETQYELNRINGPLGLKHSIGTKSQRQSTLAMVATYDFAVLGGAVGSVNLLDCDGKAATLPKGAIITMCIIDIITTFTSGGSATVALGSGVATNDLKAATAFGSYTAGLLTGIQTGATSTAIKLTADGTMSATIAVAALTAGKCNVVVEYVVSI